MSIFKDQKKNSDSSWIERETDGFPNGDSIDQLN